MSRLICPQCEVGPFTIRKAYDAHVAACAPAAATEPQPEPESEPELFVAPQPEPLAPTPEPEATTDEQLVCAECGAGPYTTIKGYKAHLRGHNKVACPECGRPCAGRGGLAKHAAHVHGTVSRTAADRAAKRERAAARAAAKQTKDEQPRRRQSAAEALADLLPGSPLVDRFADFVAKHQPDPDIWIVATLDGDPRLCRVGQIGLLAQREHQPIIGVRVSDIYDHLRAREAVA